MKLVQFLVAAMLLVFVGSVYAEKPKPVIEQNLDTNGDIKVAIQNTNAIPVHEQGLVDVNVTGGTVTVDSIPNIVIESMPPMLNGDHPALTSFSQMSGFNVTSEQIANMYFNDVGNKVCNPGDKMIITTITGYVSGEVNSPKTLPLSVKINQPVLYYLDSGYLSESFASRYTMIWNEKTNVIIDADPKITLSIWQGPTFGSNTWAGMWSIFGYCFTP